MRVVLIRHSKTAGNLKGRYIGTTDRATLRGGNRLLEGKTYPAAELVYVSPMKRCRGDGESYLSDAYPAGGAAAP